MTRIIDTEVHLMHPESIGCDFAAGTDEPVRKAIHDHPDYSRISSLMTLDALLVSMEQNAISHCHLMGMPWRNEAWNEANNEYIEACVRQHPDKFSGMYIPHLGDLGIAAKRVGNLDKSTYLGVKLITGWQDVQMNDPVMYPLYEAIQENSMFLMLHVDHMTQSLDGDAPQKLLDVVCRYPDLKILATHMGGLLCLYHLQDKVRDLMKNVIYITSVSSTMDFVRYASEINPTNIVYGSDYPFNHCHDQCTQLKEIEKLPRNVCNLILFENAERIFNYGGGLS